MSGIFIWILEGLHRILYQKNFSKCAAIDNACEDFQKKRDSVSLFLSEYDFISSDEPFLISRLYPKYKSFCIDEGLMCLGKSKFMERLTHLKFVVKRLNIGNVVYMKSISS